MNKKTEKSKDLQKAIKDDVQISNFNSKDGNEILTLERAKQIAEYISSNPAFNTQFGEKDEDGNEVVNISAIVTCLMLGSEMGLKPMESLQFGKMLNRHNVIKVHKGKVLGLDPITAMQNLYIWNSNGNELLYTGIHIVTKILNENNIGINVIEDGKKIHYVYYSAANTNKGEEVEYDEKDEYYNKKYTVINDGKSPDKLKEELTSGKIPITRVKTLRALIELTRGKSKVAIPYTLIDAIDAGLYPGKTSLGETVTGKDNWIKYPAAMLRKMSIMYGGRIIASDKLNGIYCDAEIGSSHIMTEKEIIEKESSIVETEFEDVDETIDKTTNN